MNIQKEIEGLKPAHFEDSEKFSKKDNDIYEGYCNGYGNAKEDIIKIVKLINKAHKEKMREVLERLRLEVDANECECGEKWKDTDIADLIKKFLDEI